MRRLRRIDISRSDSIRGFSVIPDLRLHSATSSALRATMDLGACLDSVPRSGEVSNNNGMNSEL